MKSSTNKPKRLFLFAGYDALGGVDTALVYYVRALAACGDVVVHMDNDIADDSIKKLAPHVLHAAARRHGEYDFGSYKRAYMYARDAGMLADYDFVYMANDSVYGPLGDLQKMLRALESSGADAFGPVCNPNPDHPHIQSWFIGMRPSVFLSDWFDKFIRGVRLQESKGAVTREYEQGFSKAVTAHGGRTWCMMSVKNRGVYNKVKYLYRHGLPFMKKVAFTRHGGRLGRQILYVLNHISPDARHAITTAARRTYGAEYMGWLLTNNPFKIMMRATKYGLTKARKGQL